MTQVADYARAEKQLLQVFKDRQLWLVLAGYVLLALAWDWVVPPYEAPDEPAHIQYVEYFAAHQGLPDTRVDLDVAGPESTQGPLYYTLGGALLRVARLPAVDYHPADNRNFMLGTDGANLNRFIYRPSTDEQTIRLMRLLSILGGVVTIGATYSLARMLSLNSRMSLVAAAYVAFVPQFTFISAVMSNDSWAAATGAVSLLLIARMSLSPAVRQRDALILGMALGLAAISKASLLVVAPIGLLAIMQRTLPSLAVWLRLTVTYGVGFLIGGGWFFLRNIYLYGDLSNSRALAVIGADQFMNQLPLSLPVFFMLAFPQMLFRSSIGVFGWMNILLPEAVYLAAGLFMLLAGVGLWLELWKRRPARLWTWGLIAMPIVLLIGSLAAFNMTFLAYQGRLLFGVIAGMAVLLARGWAAYQRRVWPGVILAGMLGLVILNLYSLVVVYQVYR